jgi:probable F420-dependent oxidoreductase
VALSVFAAVTTRVTIGAAILLLPLRPPALVAKAFTSLDYLTSGRVVLGIGVGGEGAKDFEAVGVPMTERGARADEAMRALRELFARSPASFDGRFTRFEGVAIEPRHGKDGPPLWVGGRAPATLRRVGRLGDGWIPIWVSPERYVEGWSEVRRHAEAAGRDPEAIEPAVALPALVGDDGARAKAEAREALSLRYRTEFSPHAIERYCVAGTAGECRARIEAYADAGVRHVVFNPAVSATRLAEQVDALAEVAA